MPEITTSLRVPNYAGHPSSGLLSGQIYFNTADNALYLRTASAWTQLGAGGGTPGGATTQVQFNDAGAFGGDAGLVYNKTTDVLTVGSATATSGFNVAAYQGFFLNAYGTAGISMNPSSQLALWANNGIGAMLQGSNFLLTDTGLFGWPHVSAPDTALGRNAAGVVEINNGTVGQYRDLKLRDLYPSGVYPSGVGTINGASNQYNIDYTGVALIDTGTFRWSSSGGAAGAADTFIKRPSAGVVTITDSTGTAATGTITGKGTVPAGGTTGQQLTKFSNTNYDVGWAASGTEVFTGTAAPSPRGDFVLWIDTTS